MAFSWFARMAPPPPPGERWRSCAQVSLRCTIGRRNNFCVCKLQAQNKTSNCAAAAYHFPLAVGRLRAASLRASDRSHHHCGPEQFIKQVSVGTSCQVAFAAGNRTRNTSQLSSLRRLTRQRYHLHANCNLRFQTAAKLAISPPSQKSVGAQLPPNRNGRKVDGKLRPHYVRKCGKRWQVAAAA